MSARLADVCFADIQTFLSVTRHESISGASRELEVTPSQVSKAVARLEEQLGLNLLTRGARGVTVSDAGRRVVPQLEQLVKRLESLRRAEEQSPELTVAAPSYLNAIFLPVVAGVQPQLRLRALELPASLVRAYAAENFFDLTVLVGATKLPRPWVAEPIGSLRKALLATPELAARLGRQPVAPEALREIPFVSPLYQANGQLIGVDDGCPLAHGERRLGHEATSFGLGLELAVQSHQLLFGPAASARKHLDSGQLVEVEVAGWGEVTESLFLACNSERVLSRVQISIVKAFRAVIAELQARPGEAPGAARKLSAT